MPDFSELAIVVPIRITEPRRELIWSWVARRYSALAPGALFTLGTSHAEVFSRSEAINNALSELHQYPQIKAVLIADADHVVHEEWLAESLTTVLSGKYWCVPQVHAFLHEPMSNVWLDQPPETQAHVMPGFLPSDVDWYGYTGVSGLVMCSIEAVRDVRGFDERFDGWGLQDAGFAVAITGLGYERVKEHWCGHLWHPKNEAEPRGVGQEFGNWEHFRRYEAADGNEAQIRKIISEPGHDRGWWK